MHGRVLHDTLNMNICIRPRHIGVCKGMQGNVRGLKILLHVVESTDHRGFRISLKFMHETIHWSLEYVFLIVYHALSRKQKMLFMRKQITHAIKSKSITWWLEAVYISLSYSSHLFRIFTWSHESVWIERLRHHATSFRPD